MQNFIQKIENCTMTFGSGTILFLGFVFIRTFLENYANSLNFYRLSSFIDTFFHYPAFFSIILLVSLIILKTTTKEEISKLAKIVVSFSFILIVPPIIDLIVNQGGQIPYIFISGDSIQLFKSFITYFGGGAVGIGIKTEVFLVLIGLGFYIFYKTKNSGRSILGMFLLYSTIFILLASPAFIFSLQNKITNNKQDANLNTIVDFYYRQEPLNATTANRTFIVDNNNFFPPLVQKVQNQYSTTLSIIFLIIQSILFFGCLFLYSSKKFWLVLKNFRYLRIAHYFLLTSVGIYLGSGNLYRNPINSLFDFTSFFALFLGIFFAWLFAVWENDEVDVEIDKISNKNRPLVETETSFSKTEWKILKYLFLFYALSFSFLSGFYSFVFILLFIFVYHIYSTPPLRLKRFIGISSFLIAVNALLVVWMGFFISAGTETLNIFPTKYILGILLIFLLVENVKNIKDIEGDKKEGIKTLPVIFGEKKSKLIMGICLFLATLMVPFIFYFNLYTFLLAIFFGIILFFLTNRKNFEEKYLFITYFIFTIIFFGFFIF